MEYKDHQTPEEGNHMKEKVRVNKDSRANKDNQETEGNNKTKSL